MGSDERPDDLVVADWCRVALPDAVAPEGAQIEEEIWRARASEAALRAENERLQRGYVPQDIAQECLAAPAPLDVKGEPNTLWALTLKAMKTIEALRADVDRLNAYIRKSIADTGQVAAGELLRAAAEMAKERHAQMEALRADLAKAKERIGELEGALREANGYVLPGCSRGPSSEMWRTSRRTMLAVMPELRDSTYDQFT